MRIRSCGSVPMPAKAKGRDVTGNRATSDVVPRATVPHYPPIRPELKTAGVMPAFVGKTLTRQAIADLRTYEHEQQPNGSWQLLKAQREAFIKAQREAVRRKGK